MFLDAVLYDPHENDIPGVYDLDKYYAAYDLLHLCISLTDFLIQYLVLVGSQSFLLI